MSFLLKSLKKLLKVKSFKLFLRLFETLNFAQFGPESTSTFTVCRQAATA
jgi:hypothetical protein